MRIQIGILLVLFGSALLTGCSASPPGEEEERDRSEAAGKPFEERYQQRSLPTLREDASCDEILRFAFLSNASLESAYFEWRMALERVPQEGSLDNPTASFETLFSDEKARRWDRTTLGTTLVLPFPGKIAVRTRMALQEAIARRRMFEDRKFMVQADVVGAWAQLRFVDRMVGIEERNLALLRDMASNMREMLAVGKAMQKEVTKADLEVAMAENELRMRQAERAPALARLNSLLSRAADAPLRPSSGEPPPVMPLSDAVVLELAGERNSEVRALAAEVRGSENALKMAWLMLVPDLQIEFSQQGTMEKMLGAMIMLPLQASRIAAAIREAEAGQRAAEARLRAGRDDLRTRVVLDLTMARDSGRQMTLLRDDLLPRAREIVESEKAAYAAGTSTFLELLDSQRAVLELDRMHARVESTLARSAASLEAMCALDFETLVEERKR